MISYILKEPKCVEAQEGPKPVPQGREVLGPYPLCRHLRLGYPSVQRHL